MNSPVNIIVMPLRHGRFRARLGDRVIVKSSRQPLLDAARVLLATGAGPAAPPRSGFYERPATPG
jgi:hypothetical protein